ncbi:capsular biosynthesis protein [Listeria booriae]|uniref:Capsular biosynthesis protein n=1 Tax=Listeria booriae TaxID=1552123 RepID=A0A7X0Y0V5_9LIST|nr:Wzz/FepE/Etk N-terminal domain-containing protein [Listeria booriae]MBC1794902.1 capsular biosynthesis protein [Listeria booriae]MBC1796977.1 capsular biosynthesis protein [Listeria booriae]MBC2265877.1 capsular biosynthesis protein [Listeria booriae]MBC2316596.1 capsular biosynthesis protein [Listeria booriae]MDT0112217.1 Wzz/FepE/Etk N-terminal domain-containing protein [Listeria booriae]
MDTLFSIKDVIAVLKKSILWIVSFAVGGLVIAGLAVYLLITPMYADNTQILVSQTSENENAISQNAEVQANLQLVNTYRVLLTSPRILNEVEKNIDEAYTADELADKITVSTEQDSQVMNITATDSDPEMAATIANETAQAFKKITPTVMKVDNINILSKAHAAENPVPVSPKPYLVMALGLLAGTLFGIIFAFARNLLYNTFKEEKDIEALDVPLLGSIGKLPSYKSNARQKKGEFNEKQTIS